METGLILKSLREMAGLKPDEVATKLKVSRSHVYAIEKGEVESPGIEIVKKWVRVCKPKENFTDWLSLSSQILFDDSVVKVIETMADNQPVTQVEAVVKTIAPKWLNDLVPYRFLKSLKK